MSGQSHTHRFWDDSRSKLEHKQCLGRWWTDCFLTSSIWVLFMSTNCSSAIGKRFRLGRSWGRLRRAASLQWWSRSFEKTYIYICLGLRKLIFPSADLNKPTIEKRLKSKTHTYIYVYACMYIYIYVYMYMYIYAYIFVTPTIGATQLKVGSTQTWKNLTSKWPMNRARFFTKTLYQLPHSVVDLRPSFSYCKRTNSTTNQQIRGPIPTSSTFSRIRWAWTLTSESSSVRALKVHHKKRPSATRGRNL